MVELADRRQWGWAGRVEEFLETTEQQWLHALHEHHLGLLGAPASTSQRTAWTDEGRILRSTLRDVCVANPDAREWGLVFEYELPLEGGRRPDVVLLCGGGVVVLEFKGSAYLASAAIDQVVAYARDLSEYHAMSHGLPVTPVVVVADATHPAEGELARVESPASLAAVLADLEVDGVVDLGDWLHSEYAPLPMLVAAARRIFQNEPLPAVRRALSSSVPAAVELLGQMAERAALDGRRVLAFVAGVPGSGKTLAGLSLVYERTSRLSSATFLSGNGPLVEVLRDALQSRVFVNDLHAFIKTYGLSKRIPREHVIVFDEAQRAWDEGYMSYKHGIQRSEPDLLIDIGERLEGWAALVGLVGDGQEIHAGEEAGLAQWHDAVRSRESRLAWEVHCPPRLAPVFPEVPTVAHEALDLKISLRSRRAEHLHDWVAAVLAGRFGEAARLAEKIRAEGFSLQVGRDLSAIRSYLWERYADESDARFGLLASSRTQGFLPRFGVDSSFPATKRVKLARWYNEGRGHPQSCCELREVVTEFGCQGLELDHPVVCWGDDMVWNGTEWAIKQVRGRYPLEDAAQLRRNAYRVLLTRGRDGMVVYLPDDRRLDHTETALLASGLRPLREFAPLAELVGARTA